MDAADKRMLEREALRNMIQQWNANRLDLFELSEPNENLEFHGVMRFYFQDSGQKIATKCIRVASDATVSDVIETLIEKFRPDMRMLSLGSYSLWETHGPDDERKLEPHEKPLLVQLNWHADDREGRFLLKCLTNNENQTSAANEKSDQNFKRKLSKREKKEMKKKEKLSRLKSDTNDDTRPVAEKLYTELPETMFTRSISNPEAVMRRRRHQKLERKLQQFRSKDGAPDTGGTLKIYGSSLCPDVPYKTILVSVNDTAGGVVREMLDKYGLHRHQPHMYCIVQVDTTDNSEYILEDDECPLAILMTHPHRSSIMFHVRRRPADSQPRRRKKKVGSWGSSGAGAALDPLLVEVAPDGSPIENGLRVRVNTAVEVGSGNGVALQLYGPSIQPRHCLIAPADGGGYTVTPLHADARVTLDQRRVTNNQHIQHGSLLKFGRISTFRFVDPAQENMLNRNMAQAQHYGSGSIYDRSPTSPGDNTSGAMSPTSMTSHQPDVTDPNANTTEEYPRTMSPVSHDAYNYRDGNDTMPYNNNTLKLDNESLMMSQHLNDSKEDYIREEQSGPQYNEQEQGSVNRTSNSQYKDNYETTFDLDGNVETKSICSAKSGGSGHDNSRMVSSVSRPGQEAILPAVLEFPEQAQAHFLNAVITRLDPHAPAFKLAPVYTLYLCARYRASTHYRPELSPTERAHKLTAFLHHVATLIHATVQERCTDSAAQAFWMANASELLHFLKCDRHISSFSTQAQDLLPTTVQNAFSNLVSCFQEELARALLTLNNPAVMDATEATAPTLQALAAAMVLLRRCRVNAALTIQLFSHLFHYINAVCFNKLVTEPGAVNSRWGGALSARLALLTAWAERQGLELAADCHLARTHQAARLIQGEYRTPDEVRAALEACFKLNSVQVAALLAPICAPEIVDAAVTKARALADELYRADGREIVVEESSWLGAALLVPGDGFSAEVVRGVPPGLAEFIAPLQRGGLCRLAHQPHALGLWSVYMAGQRLQRAPDPATHIIQLHKNTNGMGLSIVAAKGAGQTKLGIYIKSVVPGGAAAADGRLAAGDQLLSVDGHSLVGITQEKAAEYLVRTGPTVTLEVAKQGAVLHGLATLLHQPAYNARQAAGSGGKLRRASERDLPSRLAAEPVKPSKSVPALHHVPNTIPANVAAGAAPISTNNASWANKSRSSHNLAHDGFYQNVPSAIHSPPSINDRWSSLRSSNGSNRPQSAHFAAQPAHSEGPPDSPLHQTAQNHNAIMSARAAKLAEMSEEVTRRQQQQQQMQYQQKSVLSHQHHNHQMYNSQPVLNQMMSPTQQMLSPGPQQSQSQLLNQNPQLMSPTQQMMSPNQQIHNHSQAMINSNQSLNSNHQMMSPNQQMMSPNQKMMSPNQQMMSPNQQMMSPNQQMMSPNQQMMSSNQQIINQNHMHVHPGAQSQAMYGASPQLPPHQHLPQNMAAQQMYQNQNMPQRYEWSSTAGPPPSPPRTQPPVAPKPQNIRRSELEMEEQHQHLQQPLNVTIQPDEEQYVGSALEALYGGGGAHNPWQREERERLLEQRRAAARHRRDAAIAQLISLGANRSSVQNQQLRALQLERDFERRATQHEQDEAPLDPPTEEEDRISPTREKTLPNPLPNPPKSILKTNRPEAAATNGYATDNQSEQSAVSELTSSMSGVSVGGGGGMTEGAGPAVGPPPPPERGSSFAVMANRARALSPAADPAPHPAPPAPPQSPMSRDKRVSFHAAPPPPAASPPREDPDRFIEEAESMLASPTTPTGGLPGSVTHTPGVIGAQEVYRDPRARRLAAAARAAPAEPPEPPEQLSFHDKMKMFALDAGAATPKDKVKISRAQRDIDAVH